MEALRKALDSLKSKFNSLLQVPLVQFFDAYIDANKDYSCGYFRATLRDGNVMETTLHARGATLVGVDKFGNKYYEKLNTQFGRHRFVEYADVDNYDASTVPPEWHGWLHYITDQKAPELEGLKPVRYGLSDKAEPQPPKYYAKGHALNPGQKDWRRYEPWHS